MARVTAKMGLRVWDQLGDQYDHAQLADNLVKIDYHDHTPGRGVRIPTDGIADGAVTPDKLSNDVAVAAFMPTGVVIPYAGLTTQPAPNGFLFADGGLYDGTLDEYFELWTVIGTTYGGTGQASFKVPELCYNVAATRGVGRVPVGKRESGIASTLGGVGGVVEVTLTGAQSGVNGNGGTDTDGAHSHNVQMTRAGTPDSSGGETPHIFGADTDLVSWFESIPQQTGTDGGHGHSLAPRNADSPHDNMPPYQAVNYIIKL